MGSQIPTGSDRTRTNWTLAMENYFVDLLLDQVHRGNRMGHRFNKQAWNEMLAMFNAAFRSPYDINVLKSHYTSLWTQFNDVRNLLDQDGFSWDETTQMVTASNLVWDAYIKAHPDAQSYRNKVLVNINDLCLIYAHTIADGRYSLSSHDIEFDDDVQGVKTGFMASTPTILNRECPATDLTLAMDRYFVKLMMGQLENGNKMHDTFNRKAWKYMLKLFNNKFDAQYDKSFLKHRYKKIRSYYIDVKDLLEVEGFSWDEKQQRIVADDDIWNDYIKAHSHMCSYRNKTLLNYQDLGLIYGNAIRNGHYSELQEGREKDYHSSDGDEYLGGEWTSHMDGYFVDLLLNQVLKGNKISHEFTYRAWSEMFTLFSAKFGSHYSKDVLKNRYKYLRKQYNDLKDLFKQPGFFPDGKHERVTANNYISAKVHPDALSHRNKFLPIYHKLCMIYGEDISEERYSHSTFSADLDSDGPVSMMGGEDIQDHTIATCSRKDWTPSMDRYLIDLMLEEVRRGNKINYVLNSQTWIDVLILFKERFGVQFDKDFLKTCYKGLEMLYHDMRNLIDQRGFSWDETRQMVTAYDDVWDAYIKEHPDAYSYRNKRKPNYNDLCLIYGNSDPHLVSNLANCNGIKYQNSHWKSDWTPPMDRYFVDLMLEEVRNGSMVDHKFDKLAWRDMVAKFRAKFGPQYGKDVFKSRFIILRKRFLDMKILLDHCGFAWDEMRQMIMADDKLWDAYVKEHPDVKMYRNRTLPNFHELFLIYGNSNCGKNHNNSSCSVDAKDNERSTGIFSILPILLDPAHTLFMSTWIKAETAGEYSQSTANGDTPMMAWTVKMDCYLISLLLEQLNRGNKIGYTFSRKSWASMTASLNKEFGLHCDKYALEDRYSGIMRVHKDITCLLNQNGIAWEEILHTSKAKNIWDAYFKGHPEAISYGESVLDNYSDLCLIFGNLHQNRRPGCLKIELNMSSDNFGMETDEIMGDLQSSVRKFEIHDQRKKRKFQAVPISSSTRKVHGNLRIEVEEDMEEQLERTRVRNEEEKDYNSIESVVAALQTVPDLNDELFLEACVLLEDESKAKMFVAMDATARRKWLLKKLRQ